MIVIIVGSFGSGTTFLSERLHESGITMWTHNLMAHEDADIYGMNQVECIYSTAKRNHNPMTYDPSEYFVKRLTEYREYRETCSDGDWGCKEPQIIWFTKAYAQVFPDAKYICCIRNPLSCIESQRKKNKYLQGDGLALKTWTYYLLNFLTYGAEAELAAHFFNYDADMELEQAALSKFLGREIDLVSAFKWKQARRLAIDPIRYGQETVY